jgi:hypothetical protein
MNITDLISIEIGLTCHQTDARGRCCGAIVKALQSGMRIRRAQKRNTQTSARHHIIAVASCTGDKPSVFNARYRLTNGEFHSTLRNK